MHVAGCRQTACESAAVQMSSPSSQTNRQPDRRTDRLCDASFTGGSGCQAGIASVGATPQHSPPFQPQIWRQAAVQKRQGECGTRSGAGPAPTWPSPSFWSVPLHFPPRPPPPSHPSLHLLHFHYLPFPAQSLHFASLKPVSQHKTHVSLCTAFNCLNWLAGYIACLA